MSTAELIAEWCGRHWFLAFVLAYCALYSGARIVTRFYRMVSVMIRGWPPAHLDADGDVVKSETTRTIFKLGGDK